MEAKEVARRIHEKLMSQHQSGSRALWQGTGDQLAEVLNEVKREAEQPAPHPAEPDPAPVTPGQAYYAIAGKRYPLADAIRLIDAAPDLLAAAEAASRAMANEIGMESEHRQCVAAITAAKSPRPAPTPATPGPATKAMLEYHRKALEELQEMEPDLDFDWLGNTYLIAIMAFLDEWGVARPRTPQDRRMSTSA